MPRILLGIQLLFLIFQTAVLAGPFFRLQISAPASERSLPTLSSSTVASLQSRREMTTQARRTACHSAMAHPERALANAQSENLSAPSAGTGAFQETILQDQFQPSLFERPPIRG